TQVMHIRPILDGCFLHSKLYLPKTKSDFDRLKVLFQKCNLKQIKLKVAANEQTPFCEIIQTNRQVKFGNKFSIDSDILQMLQQKYQFDIEIIYAKQIY